MPRARRLYAKFVNLFRRQRIERDLAREVAAHLALLQDDFERRGLSPCEAHLAARRAYGGVEWSKELHRDERSFVWLEQTIQDLRHACRSLARTPAFTLVAILTLALGVGVNTTLFTSYNALVLKPLPVADPNRVVRFERWFESRSLGNVQYAFSYPEYLYCRDHNTAFASLVAGSWQVRVFATVPRTADADTAEPEKLNGQLVSANYF